MEEGEGVIHQEAMEEVDMGPEEDQESMETEEESRWDLLEDHHLVMGMAIPRRGAGCLHNTTVISRPDLHLTGEIFQLQDTAEDLLQVLHRQ